MRCDPLPRRGPLRGTRRGPRPCAGAGCGKATARRQGGETSATGPDYAFTIRTGCPVERHNLYCSFTRAAESDDIWVYTHVVQDTQREAMATWTGSVRARHGSQ